MSVIGRLLVLLAVLLMPFGMAPAAASAPADHHATMAGMAMEHCPDQSNKHEPNHGLALCSMACASALPAQDVARDETSLRHHELVIPMMVQTLHSVLQEIATPPPKFA